MEDRFVGGRQELEEIARLHDRDMEASRKGDFSALRALMSEDAVLMPPGEPWIRGVRALDESYKSMGDAMRDLEVTEYRFDFEEVVVLGDYAFEWGTVRGAMRRKGSGPGQPPESTSYKMLRILKKERGGEWQVHRAIWNGNPAE